MLSEVFGYTQRAMINRPSGAYFDLQLSVYYLMQERRDCIRSLKEADGE